MPGNALDYPDYPFCSRRCKTIDLGRWLGEEYRLTDADVPTPPPSDEPST